MKVLCSLSAMEATSIVESVTVGGGFGKFELGDCEDNVFDTEGWVRDVTDGGPIDASWRRRPSAS